MKVTPIQRHTGTGIKARLHYSRDKGNIRDPGIKARLHYPALSLSSLKWGTSSIVPHLTIQTYDHCSSNLKLVVVVEIPVTALCLGYFINCGKLNVQDYVQCEFLCTLLGEQE